MDGKNTTRRVSTRSKLKSGASSLTEPDSRNERKDAPALKTKQPTAPNKSRARAPSDTSDDIDEDYAEFLKTYDPREESFSGFPSDEGEGSQITVESTAKSDCPKAGAGPN
jgi:hypothetical protein